MIHEIGHYLAARAMGVAIKELAVGMGPKLFSFRRNKIEYSFRALPIGGFLNMVGEDETSDDERAITKKPIWKRFVVLISGSLMNIILGFIVMSILVSTASGFYSVKVLRFETGAMSESTGLQLGDEIIKVNNKKVNIYYDLFYAVMRLGNEPVSLTVKRGGEKIVIENVTFPTMSDSGTVYGLVDFSTEVEKKTFGTWIKQSFYQPLSTIDLVWSSFYDLITGRYGVENMSGVVGVTQVIGDAAKESRWSLLYTIALITMNLGVANLLPLPALDGGRLVFLLIEFIRRKPIKPEHEGYVHLAGMAVLFAFMIFMAYNDIARIFSR